MYAKCGDLHTVEQTFEYGYQRFEQPHIQLALWNAKMSAYADFGKAREAISTFNHMQQVGVIPNSITFVSLIAACSHGGLDKEALEFYNYLPQYSIHNYLFLFLFYFIFAS
jgi:pentatricopeptide repeat protein